jgi:hypothetical protein
MTPADVAVLPAASRATAVSVWAPAATVTVFQITEYGLSVTSAPILVPSTLNCTPATATLSAAQPDTTTEPETVAPAAGDLKKTIGGVVSGDVGFPTTLSPVGVHGAAEASPASTLPSNAGTTTQIAKVKSLQVRAIRTRVRMAIIDIPWVQGVDTPGEQREYHPAGEAPNRND